MLTAKWLYLPIVISPIISRQKLVMSNYQAKLERDNHQQGCDNIIFFNKKKLIMDTINLPTKNQEKKKKVITGWLRLGSVTFDPVVPSLYLSPVSLNLTGHVKVITPCSLFIPTLFKIIISDDRMGNFP